MERRAGSVRELQDDPELADAVLAPYEQARRDRLVHPDDRAAYETAHRLARVCVARLTGTEVARIELTQYCATCGGTDHGRPSAQLRAMNHADPAVPLDVSVSWSHTRTHVAAIASRGSVCGIDVETRAASIPQRALTTREQAWVERQADPELAFTRLWVRKEALAKAGAAPLTEAAQVTVLDDEDAPITRRGLLAIEEFILDADAGSGPVIACIVVSDER